MFIRKLGLTIALVTTSIIPATAAPETLQPLHAHCMTDGTGADGSGKNCSDSACTSAPDGYIIIREKYQVAVNSNNGGHYGVDFSEQQEVIPGSGITQPKKVCITVGANSQAGVDHVNARGWMDVTGNGAISKYK